MRRARLFRNAARALALLLKLVPVQPLCARVASDNAESLKVLQKKRFAITGAETGLRTKLFPLFSWSLQEVAAHGRMGLLFEPWPARAVSWAGRAAGAGVWLLRVIAV